MIPLFDPKYLRLGPAFIVRIGATKRCCVVMKVARDLFDKMTPISHFFECWDQFKRGKRKRKDIQCFERNLEDNIFQLQRDLVNFQHLHAPYDQSYVAGPK